MNHTTIFTDGAARSNPGPGGWGSIIIFPERKIMIQNKESGIKNQGLVQELGGREKHTTNNRMELTAVIEALDFVLKLKAKSSQLSARVHLDSSYVLNGATKWVHNWQKNNWKTKTKKAVLNQDLWEKLARLSLGTAEAKPRLQIDWRLVKGHAGTAGNERCDVIATSFADGHKPKLYGGDLKKYPVSLLVGPVPKAISHKLKPKSSAKAYSYVSCVNGVVKTHATWAECEKRVKGVSGTKFKKSFSKEDEEILIKLWSAKR